ncbi:MAG: hypothetical protein LBN26_07270 [Christensenellaceae bacterium]|jgi:dTMP kinase|nr:hypothetical protein [Christensenellaceae bacterium]
MRGKKPKVIAIEGIDGSGKSVQFKRLAEYCRACGLAVDTREYPVYTSFFGQEVGRYLSGAQGVQADTVDGKSMALWFALDRWEDLKAYQTQADVLVINRYVLSNAVYQSIRDIDLARPDIIDWVFELEYGHFGLPAADVYIYYDVDIAKAGENVLKKGHRDYVGEGKDVYEASGGIQARARAKYLEVAARREDILVIDCMKDGLFLSIDEIAQATQRALHARGIL